MSSGPSAMSVKITTQFSITIVVTIPVQGTLGTLGHLLPRGNMEYGGSLQPSPGWRIIINQSVDANYRLRAPCSASRRSSCQLQSGVRVISDQ